MKSLLEFMNRDRLKKYKIYNYFPKDREELIKLLVKLIKERGWGADLNDIDTSKIRDMSWLFALGGILRPAPGFGRFKGDISGWDVSNVENMEAMFYYSEFDNDISGWDVRNVRRMDHMFFHSKFDKDLNDWKINPKCITSSMFNNSPLEKNPPRWYKK